MLRMAALALGVSLAGCSLYLDGDDDGDPDGGIFCGGAPLQLRNPDNLECQSFGSPCPSAAPEADQAPLPSWGTCPGRCETLGEFACLVDPSCRAAYDFDCFTGTGACTALQPFIGCFSLSMTGAPAVCEGADAWSCSSSPNCVALHSSVCDASGNCVPWFRACVTENR
jgi:hypothetical protein